MFFSTVSFVRPNCRIASLVFLAGLAIAFSSEANAQVPLDATWTGGSGNWNIGANWDISTAPDNNAVNTYNVFIDDGDGAASTATLNVSSTIDTLSISAGDQLNIGNNQELVIEQGAVNTKGMLSIGGANGSTAVTLSNGTILSGNGTINLTHSAHSHLRSEPGGGSFTIGANLNVTGRGQIGDNLSTIVNNGIVEANGLASFFYLCFSR